MPKQTVWWLAWAAFMLGLALPTGVQAGDVPLWEREGTWLMGPRLVKGESPLPCWSREINFWTLETVVENALVQGIASFDSDEGNLQGKVRTKSGRILRGDIFIKGCGDGKFKLILDGDLREASGTIKFKNQRSGKRFDLDAVYLPFQSDVYDLDLFVEFAKKKKGVLPTNKNGVIAVIFDNQGKVPLPLTESFVRLSFNFPVKVSKVVIIEQDLAGKLAVDLDKKTPVTTLDVPVAVADRLVLGVKFEPPFAASGRTFRVDAALMEGEDRRPVPMSPGPPIPMLTASSEIPVGPIPIKLKLKNKGDENIHIFLADSPKPFSDKTRVTPGKTKTLKIDAAFGESFRVGAGSAGVQRFSCTTSTVVQPGSGTVIFKPNQLAPFLSLRCP